MKESYLIYCNDSNDDKPTKTAMKKQRWQRLYNNDSHDNKITTATMTNNYSNDNKATTATMTKRRQQRWQSDGSNDDKTTNATVTKNDSNDDQIRRRRQLHKTVAAYPPWARSSAWLWAGPDYPCTRDRGVSLSPTGVPPSIGGLL